MSMDETIPEKHLAGRLAQISTQWKQYVAT